MKQLEYAVKCETNEGNVMTLRRGFTTRDAAEDHPVKISLFKRVWVEPVGTIAAPTCEPSLPPLPWNWVTSGSADARGQFHIYLVDATGKKIAAIWGREGQKGLVAQHIIALVNSTATPSPSDAEQGGAR